METIKLICKNEASLKNFLKDSYISKRASNKLIKNGILINDKISTGNKKLNKGDVVEVPIEDEKLDYEPIKGDLDILYEDEQIIIINKASGITMNSRNQVNLSNIIAIILKKIIYKEKLGLSIG